MRRLTMDGFSYLEAFLLIVIVFIIGGTGYFVYHANTSARSTYDRSTRVAGRAGASSVNSGDQAVSLVRTVYTAYTKSIGDSDKQTRISTLKPYVSDSLYVAITNFNKGYDPVTCAQMKPDGFGVSQDKAASSGTNIAVDVNENFGKTGKVVVVVDNASHRITSIDCTETGATISMLDTMR